MKILEIKSLAIPDVKVIKFSRFRDHRGFFTELYRKSDFEGIDFMKGVEFSQCNESFSKINTIRGLHFQWNPYMGKLVRTIQGKMVDLFLDIRKNSPTYGKIAAYDMPSSYDMDYNEWIWVPVGFAHGNYFTEDSVIQYFCSGSYSPGCEAGISPFSKDIDWSLCDRDLKHLFDVVQSRGALTTEKDENGYTLKEWGAKEESKHFICA